MVGIALLFWYLLVLMIIGYMVNRLMAPIFGRWWRLFVAPGVVIHELAHAAVAALMGAQVLEINFWKASGGHVVHTQPRVHILGPVVIAFAPTLVMTLGLFFTFSWVSPVSSDIAWIDHFPTSVRDFFIGYGQALEQVIGKIEWLTSTPWLVLYLVLNIAVTITPSRVDLLQTRWALLGLILLTVSLGRLLNFTIPVEMLWPPLAVTLIALSLLLVPILIIGLLVRLFR